MDYIKPDDLVANMGNAGVAKARLAVKDMLIRGALSGMILGVATTLAFQTRIEFTKNVMGGVIFPVGFVMIVLLGLELVTGSFALLPLARLEQISGPGPILANWAWVFLGNLLGSIAYGVLLAIALTSFGKVEPTGVAARIIATAEAKTIGYAALGSAGMITVFVKAILCNWLVCMGVVLAMTTTSTIGKIAAAWLPISVFFAQGFEHTVVNMFVIPTGMLMGAKVTVADWWLWNQIPVTLGNIVGGFVFTGLALYLTHKPASPKPAPIAVPMQPAE